MIAPPVALALWTHLVLLWMYAVRLPAVRRLNIVPDRDAPRGSQMASLPSKVRWKSDNYTHLLEHPTVFYATTLALAMLETNQTWVLIVAWTYVGLRVAHTLVQVTINHIPTRFVLFALGGVCGAVLSAAALVSALT